MIIRHSLLHISISHNISYSIQSTNHGGTFIFNGDVTVFSHYDESPGTHADAFESVDLAIREANKR